MAAPLFKAAPLSGAAPLFGAAEKLFHRYSFHDDTLSVPTSLLKVFTPIALVGIFVAALAASIDGDVFAWHNDFSLEMIVMMLGISK
jgi:hypothetical protein